MVFIRHSRSLYRVDTLPPPLSKHKPGHNEIFSPMSQGTICRCLLKSHVSRRVCFGRSEHYLAHLLPDGYITMGPCILSEIFLKLPLLQLVVTFLYFTGVSLSQVTPNNFAKIMAFDILCFEMNVEATGPLFCCFHSLNKNNSINQTVKFDSQISDKVS